MISRAVNRPVLLIKPFLAALLAGWLALSLAPLAYAEIRNSNTPLIRLRVGAGGPVATVIYNAGIPAELGGLPGVTAAPTTTSTNNVGGGSGTFTVRFVTDTNARPPAFAPLTGTFSYDSSSPLTCTTAATCDMQTISFTTISWEARDNDTLNTVFQYDGLPGQEFQSQTDNNNARNGTATRHRNWYRYQYDNSILLPAGTYEGTVVVSGVAN